MLIQTVIDHIKEYHKGVFEGKQIDEQTTRDKVLYGKGQMHNENQKAIKEGKTIKTYVRSSCIPSRLCAHGTMSVRCTWASCMAWHRCLTSCMQMMRREKRKRISGIWSSLTAHRS